MIRTKITAQGQISVPSEIRRKLGIGPGSVLEWGEEAGKIVLSRAGLYSSEDIHKILFPNGPPQRKTLTEIKEGVAQGIREKYARSRH